MFPVGVITPVNLKEFPPKRSFTDTLFVFAHVTPLWRFWGSTGTQTVGDPADLPVHDFEFLQTILTQRDIASETQSGKTVLESRSPSVKHANSKPWETKYENKSSETDRKVTGIFPVSKLWPRNLFNTDTVEGHYLR